MSTRAHAQHEHHMAADTAMRAPGTIDWRGVTGMIGFMGVGVASRVDPAYAGRRYTEGYFTQPNLMSALRWKALSFAGTLNGEGMTIRRGELTPGIYGEGYVDRRHPHTLLHEAMLSIARSGITTASEASGGDRMSVSEHGLSVSFSVGKGFAPYGTDDPMMRPLVKYPVNHHHAQILERAQVVGAVRYSMGSRSAIVEAGLFNGDEPTGPYSMPRLSRIGDSRSARITLSPVGGFEAQVSAAHVTSPDVVQGGALDHEQRSASVRWSNTVRGFPVYGMAEWARTDETNHGKLVWQFHSALAEGSVQLRHASFAARYEDTERPDHERLNDPFRMVLGHIDFSVLGITRWRTSTVQIASAPVALPMHWGGGHVVPFVEVARAQPRAVLRTALFQPEEFYGATAVWSYSIGARLHLGSMHERMGRYGVALPTAGTSGSSTHHH